MKTFIDRAGLLVIKKGGQEIRLDGFEAAMLYLKIQTNHQHLNAQTTENNDSDLSIGSNA